MKRFCLANIGSVEYPEICGKDVAYAYKMKQLATVYLCREHSREADKNAVIKNDLLKKEVYR